MGPNQDGTVPGPVQVMGSKKRIQTQNQTRLLIRILNKDSNPVINESEPLDNLRIENPFTSLNTCFIKGLNILSLNPISICHHGLLRTILKNHCISLRKVHALVCVCMMLDLLFLTLRPSTIPHGPCGLAIYAHHLSLKGTHDIQLLCFRIPISYSCPRRKLSPSIQIQGTQQSI